MFFLGGFVYFVWWFSGCVSVPSVVAHRSNVRSGVSSGLDNLQTAFIAGPSRLQSSFGAENARIQSSLGVKSSTGETETVTKKQLIAEIAQTVEMTQKDVGMVIDEFVKSIVKHMGENKEVSIPKFGLFHNSLRGARVMKNLQTGELYTAKPVYVPNVRFYEAVKTEINDSLKPQ
ncbi:uncharacterized protein BXIN_0416 [Babesia sp. Xinjiang]|uniref:uncharacterized protein n=1 Tax=Babesia sp. Xinjiang TaxID=462227 RepID=UPI000A248DBC|nr:uncharacterized protein BXIN_0416 [Babesia sp. Xinjiang]ORM41083.1 hypothetical protein BXIN_0416 [Babesia sp. Xinjiang]